MLQLHSRDDDGFIIFLVSRKFAEGGYVTNQENLAFEAKRLESRAKEPARNPAGGIAATSIPNGPYSSWAEESRKKAVAAVSFRCVMMSGMQLGNYQGSKEAAREMAQAILMACVDHQMPDDWPGHGKFQ